MKDKNDKKVMLSFKGKKQEIYAQLQKWCKEEGETATGTIIKLIENHLKNI
jgi:hypothetical protein